MNRLTFLLISATFLMLTTLVVNSLELASVTSPTDSISGEVDDSVGSIFSILDTFVKLLTFQISEIPSMFNLVFSIIAIGMAYVIVMVIKDVIPWT